MHKIYFYCYILFITLILVECTNNSNNNSTSNIPELIYSYHLGDIDAVGKYIKTVTLYNYKITKQLLVEICVKRKLSETISYVNEYVLAKTPNKLLFTTYEFSRFLSFLSTNSNGTYHIVRENNLITALKVLEPFHVTFINEDFSNNHQVKRRVLLLDWVEFKDLITQSNALMASGNF